MIPRLILFALLFLPAPVVPAPPLSQDCGPPDSGLPVQPLQDAALDAAQEAACEAERFAKEAQALAQELRLRQEQLKKRRAP